MKLEEDERQLRYDVVMMSAPQITYRGFLIRLRNLAKIAIESYGLESKNLKFITYSGNGLYRINVQKKDPSPNHIEPGRYALRLHQHGYMKPKYITSEMEWLSALYQDGIPVPKPIRNLNGDWVTVADGNYEVPTAMNCTLVGWSEGRLLNKSVSPKHFRSLGRVTGILHEQSVKWKRPKGFARPHWDWQGLFGDGFDYGFSAGEARNAIPTEHQKSFKEVLDRVAEFSESYGKGKKVYGLIHADLDVMDNASYFAGEIHPFDFDDCGFGYWIFDLGVVLAHHMLDSNDRIDKKRAALIAGYEETSKLALDTLEYLDLFIAARLAQLMFFYQGHAVRNPANLEQCREEVDSCAKILKKVI
ncbi:MAG: phosphotransferase [Candidatus Thorarchaeota archaeon]